VDQDDLDRAGLATVPDDPAVGPDDPLGHDRPPRRSVEMALEGVDVLKALLPELVRRGFPEAASASRATRAPE
jgi:hypothetical protein